MSDACIKPLDRLCVDKLSSGQIITSSSCAIKELIENSIDAGAKNIEIRLKDFGSHLIEVIDDGSGIAVADRRFVCRKHHTSKLTSYEDLNRLTSYGFRGEALNALCALSRVSIATKTSEDVVGTSIEFDHKGEITNETSCPLEVGTKISIKDLFCTLPVRRKDLLKNLRKQYNVLLSTIQSYALILLDTRLILNHVLNGEKQLVFCTRFTHSFLDNVIEVFGVQQKESLMKFQQLAPNEDDLTSLCGSNYKPPDFELLRVSGLISFPLFGHGRNASDRQFLYINSRPCVNRKLSKMINSLYRDYNCNQFPFFLFNIEIENSKIDVNVSPNKKTVFIQHENYILSIFQTSLKSMFDKVKCKNFSVYNKSSSSQYFKNFFASPSMSKDMKTTETKTNVTHLKEKCQKSLSRFKISDVQNEPFDASGAGLSCQSLQPKHSSAEDKSAVRLFLNTISDSPSQKIGNKRQSNDNDCVEGERYSMKDKRICNELHEQTTTTGHSSSKLSIDEKSDVNIKRSLLDYVTEIGARSQASSDHDLDFSADDKCFRNTVGANKMEEERTTFEVQLIDLKIDALEEDMINLFSQEASSQKKFKTTIHDGSPIVEDELNRNLCSSDFLRMDVIGQFNKGFIIAKFNSDLFIIDQHAADECYKFQTLLNDSSRTSQALVSPLNLQLDAASESLLIDNIAFFKKHGYGFEIKEDKPIGQKVSLSKVPANEYFTFTAEDLSAMLEDIRTFGCIASSQIPLALKRLYASKACRSSVMIGTDLSHRQMLKILEQLSTINKPWHCAHGRPTLRHLYTLH